MNRLLDHAYILSMVAFTAYSQMIMRWQVGAAGPLPTGTADKIWFIAKLLMNPWVLSSIVATFMAGVSWMLALTKFQLSYAYPFTGLIYLFVLVAGYWVFRDNITVGRVVGTAVVLLGTIIIVRAG